VTPSYSLYVTRAIIVLVLLGTATITVLGQETAARPDRGVMPNGSYAVSEIENISLNNGNVNLRIPLASLPPIAGGKLSWTINAHYNSKIWDVTRVEMLGERYDLSLVPYVVDTLQLSDRGGWRISGQYEIEIRDARMDIDYQTWPVDDQDYNLLLNYNWYRVVLKTPDGAEHELRPMDYSSYPGVSKEFLQGYYNPTPYTHGTMRYYSFDGSYLYAVITSDNNWTVYMPDGTKVVQTTDGLQRVQDTNGNKIKIWTDSNGTHYQDEQTGREIRYGPGPSGQGVYYKTVNGSDACVRIVFGETNVQGQLYKVKDWTPGQVPAQPGWRTEEINTPIPVIREIILPETQPGVTRKFSFDYNSDDTEIASNPTRTASKGWGYLSHIETPSGAKVDYTYNHDGWHLLFFADDLAKLSITQKKLDHDGVIDTWTYSINDGVATVTNPDGSTITENKFGRPGQIGSGYGGFGLSYRTIRPFMKTERHWTHMVFDGANSSSPSGPVDFNSVVDYEYTTLTDAAGNNLKMSAKAFQYDFNGNVTQTTEYDWFDPALVSRDTLGVPTGVPGSATVLRTTTNSYYNPATSASSGNVYAKRSISTATPLILNALQQTSTGPATAQFSYDGYAYGTAPTVGNLTSNKVWADLDSKWITTGTTYNSYGNVTSATDGRGEVTYFYYDDSTHALPTRVVVDPENGTGTQTTATAYDYYTGLVTSVTDPNNAVSTIDYTNQLLPAGIKDPFGRPGIQYGPSVGGQRQRITTTYFDNSRQVVVATDLNAEDDKLLKARTTVDMLGRPVLMERTEDGTNYTIFSIKAYDSVNRMTYSSGPMRCTIQGGNNCSANPLQYVVTATTNGWTRTKADTAGRVTEVATFAGATQPSTAAADQIAGWTGSVSTSYSSNEVTVTDQAGKQRKSVTNALGQLTSIFENPAVLNYQTSYDYDVFGNLRHVYLGSQTRTFTYDSLSRLRSAANPESGTITYAYDDNGNLTSKVDARSITTTFSYDSVNRVTSRSYSDGTPTVTYAYDAAGVTNSKGRLTSVSSSVSATNYTAYNARGSVTASNQVTDSQTYSMTYAYILAGSRTSMTYPSGRVITNEFDNAGRLTGVRDQSSGVYYSGAASTDATNRMQYAAHGAVSVMKLGNGLWEHTNFNARLQPTEIGLGTTSTNSSTMGLTYNYGTTNNNGNVQSLSHSGGGLSYTQNFGYDALNRLTTSNENSGSSWSEANGYDRYGNRWVDLGGGNQSLYFNSANNRITTSGYVYDAAGNLTNDTLHTYGFDAENKIKTVDGVSDVYRYDGDGNRVRKNFATGEKVRMVYSGGQLIAEYDLSNGALKKEYVYGANGLVATIEPTNGTRYTTADHLGSPRVITNSSGGVVSRHDYMPFGIEIGVTVGGRTAGMGYGVIDNVRQKFTQKERDNETGLDYFGARYYSSVQGRFTGPDKPFVDQDDFEPQSWNLYVYTRNNPLRYIDEFGEEIVYASPELESLSNSLRKASSTYDAALKGYEGKGAPDLTIQYGDAGIDANGVDKATGLAEIAINPEVYDGSEYPAKPIKIIPARVKNATITIDNSIKGKNSETEDVMEHEVGHVDHARKDPRTYADNSAETKRTKGKTPHDKRPNEVIANQFRNQVKKEKKAYEKKQKDEEKQRKKEEKERKKLATD
jgi:RHS repeat-associated protein